MVDPVKMQDAVEQMDILLAAGNPDAAAEYLRGLHSADAAEILAHLEPESQALLAPLFEPNELADFFEQMDEADAVDVASHLDLDAVADVLDEMEPDMAADLLAELEPDEATRVLEQMDEADAVAPLMAYPEDSAGGIMNLPPPSLRRQMTVSEAYRYIKEHYHDANEIFYLYVLDRYGRLIGVVNLRALILADQAQTIEEIMQRDVLSVRVDTDQERVANLFARYDLLAIPVVDMDNRLVGIVTIDDVVDVLEEEATEDIYRLAQISEDAEIFSPLTRALRNRLPWLYVNSVTALLAAAVVAMYEDTIAALALLAVFMPVVAGMGGNAGNQTMTIVVRSLALGEISVKDVWHVLLHELPLGLLKGFFLGLTMFVVAWLWKGNLILGLVFGLAMLINMVVATSAGVLVPIILKRIGVDPALASSVFVTTATDVAGFAAFLGLATVFLRFLQ